MMFAGGVQVRGRDSFAARICTSGCVDTIARGLASRVIIGDLIGQDQGAQDLAWSQASVLDIPHNRTGLFVGPEDPRLDVVGDSRFILANVNVDVQGCPAKDHAYENPRHMFFAPVDAIPGSRACRVQLEGVSPCQVQKNWAPLVPRGSKDIHFVYSLSPLRVLRFDQQSCTASFLADHRVDSPASTLGNVHGGTRFVHGMAVREGDLYFAIGHTAPPGYEQVLVAVLVQPRGASTPNGSNTVGPIVRSKFGKIGEKLASVQPELAFHLVGVSCPIDIAKLTAASKGNPMVITTSIINFDPDVDLARITFQMHETHNYQTELHGISDWLRTTYDDFKHGGPVYCAP